MSRINVTQYSAVTEGAQNPQSPGRRDGADILVLKLRCNKRSAYAGRRTASSSKRKPHFETRTCLGENKNLGHVSLED
jgi:hypothetical protein